MTPALFSISYAGFWGQATLSLSDFIVHTGRLGYGSVMIAGERQHLSPLDASPETLDSIRRTLDDADPPPSQADTR